MTEDELLREAYQDVVPLEPEKRERVRPPRPEPHTGERYDEDSEILEELDALVEGDAPFDSFPHKEEYRQWAAAGVHQVVVDRLADGDIPYQAHIDLHGHTREEAREALERFLKESIALGRTSVLVVHGRGKRSPEGRAVLRTAVHSWLRRGALGRLVAAYTTARAVDGGGGATYVLLTEPCK